MKFINSKLLEDLEVLTDTGWVSLSYVHMTKPYEIFEIKTESFKLKCADEHIVFNVDMNEVYVKNLKIGDKIFTENGLEEIIDITVDDEKVNMYDLELCEESNKRYYTDGVLSHNSSYIKYLTSQINDKKILFVPPAMAETLSDPSIIPFLMEHQNSILIIEDAEKVISDRETNGSSAGVSNILNLTDGILGDCLNIQILATFNMKKEKIDQALLRAGRLIAEHKFTILSVDETNKLLKKLNKKHISNVGMTLADIYNIDEDIYKTTNKNSKIGF